MSFFKAVFPYDRKGCDHLTHVITKIDCMKYGMLIFQKKLSSDFLLLSSVSPLIGGEMLGRFSAERHLTQGTLPYKIPPPQKKYHNNSLGSPGGRSQGEDRRWHVHKPWKDNFCDLAERPQLLVKVAQYSKYSCSYTYSSISVLESCFSCEHNDDDPFVS